MRLRIAGRPVREILSQYIVLGILLGAITGEQAAPEL